MPDIHDTLTRKQRHDLALFCYEQGYLDDHILGHYPADLLFGQKEADADQQAAPDDFYFQGAGEEPPPAKAELEDKAHWYNCLELNILLTAIAVMLVILVFWPVGGW